MQYNLTLTIGSTSPSTVYTQANVVQQFLTNWTKTYWIGGTPQQQINIDFNLPYLETTNYLPNFEALTVPTSKSHERVQLLDECHHDVSTARACGRPICQRLAAAATSATSTVGTCSGSTRETGASRAVALGQADLASAWGLNAR